MSCGSSESCREKKGCEELKVRISASMLTCSQITLVNQSTTHEKHDCTSRQEEFDKRADFFLLFFYFVSQHHKLSATLRVLQDCAPMQLIT